MTFSLAGKRPNAPDKHHKPGLSVDSLALLVEAIVAEAAELTDADRSKLAARILELGGYESADEPGHDNDRARLALRIAARLSSAD